MEQYCSSFIFNAALASRKAEVSMLDLTTFEQLRQGRTLAFPRTPRNRNRQPHVISFECYMVTYVSQNKP